MVGSAASCCNCNDDELMTILKACPGSRKLRRSPSAGSCPQRLASRYIQRVRRSARARLIPGPLRSRILTSTLLSSSERPVLSACATAALCCERDEQACTLH
ncbi:hypothetical protein EJB05_28668, partial [Eragrostis curvula]